MSNTDEAVVAALAMARYRALRTGLLDLHKAILDAERRRYERTRGPIDGSQHALRLVMTDPWFAWLRPMADLIVLADERLATDLAIAPADVGALAENVRGLLHHDIGGADFREPYQRVLQDVPDVVVAHARVIKLLAD